MSLTTATVTNFAISALVDPQILNPLVEAIQITKPLTFASVTNLKVTSGTYTPANNSLSFETAGTILSNATAPTFLMLFCDGQVNLSCESGAANFLEFFPVSNSIFFTVPAGLTAYISVIKFDGRNSIANPMAQGVPVNYTIIYGTAVIT